MITRMGDLILAQWKEARPSVVAEMEREGVLIELLETVQEKAKWEAAGLVQRGLKVDQAMEIVLSKLRVPTEEESSGTEHLPFI